MAKYEHRHQEWYRDVKIDVKAHTSKELISKVEKRRAEIDRGIVDDKVKLSKFGELFLESHKKNTVSASWYQDLCYIWAVIVSGIGDRAMKDTKPLHLQNYLNSLTNISDGYVKKQYDLIKQVFRQAYINGVTPTDYTLGLVRPHGAPVVTGRSITDHERKILLQVLDGHRGEIFCKLMLYCGLRPSEVQALIWKDIDLRKKTITVNKSLKRDGSIGDPKTTAAYRTIPIPDHLIPLLQRHKGSPFDNVFSHNVTWRRRMWENVQREMNIAMGCKVFRNKLQLPLPLADDFALYNLRHTYCTDLEKMGVPINIASRLMGHSNISITSKVYTHASTEALEKARDLINGTDRSIGKREGKIAENG